MSLKAGIDFNLQAQIPATELGAGTTIELIAPQDGFMVAVRSIVQTAIVTGGTLTVKIGTTDVPGASITVADAATKGIVQTAIVTPGADGVKVKKGDRIQLVPSAAFNSGGALGVDLEFSSAGPNPALG